MIKDYEILTHATVTPAPLPLVIPWESTQPQVSTFPLYNAERQCTDCYLHKHCLGPVPGVGPINATVMLVGEGPGEHEDETGRPFTGTAGQMLDEMLDYIGLDRNQVFIANCVRCRVRNNATPSMEDVHFCADKWLAMEIRIIKPQIIVAMGQPAIRYLLDDDTLTVEHTHAIPQWRTIEGQPVMVFPVYHPAAGLYTTSQLRMVFDDFRVLGDILQGANPESYVPVDQYPLPVYTEVTTTAKALELLSMSEYSLDTETVPGPDGVSVLWSVQVSSGPGTAWFIPAHLIPDPKTCIPETSLVWVHNYLYDEQFIHMPKFVDTMVMAYLLGLPQGLKQLAWRLCGMEMKDYDEYVAQYRQDRAMEYLMDAEHQVWDPPVPLGDVKWDNKHGGVVEQFRKPMHMNTKIWKLLDDVQAGKLNKAGEPTDIFRRWQATDSREREQVEAVHGPMLDASLEQVPHDQAVYYSSRDADATWRVKGILQGLVNERELGFVLNAVDIPTLPVLMEMMDQGMPINRQHFLDLSREYTARLNVSAVRCANAGGFGTFNPNSPHQVADLVYGRHKLGFPITKRTDTGMPSTDDRELKKVKHPVVAEILEYRSLLKLKTTYCDVIAEEAIESDGWWWIHTILKATRTETGRLTSSEPINLQAIPIRTEEGRRIRQGFEAPPGYVLLTADYSQIEMRQVAHETQSPYLLQLFWDDLDMHTFTASLVFGISYEEANQSKYRYPMKRVNFGIIYGITAQGLYEGLLEEGIEGWSLMDCEDLLATYDERFPEVKAYRQLQTNHARRWGFVKDWIGRMRFIPEVFCPVKRIKAEGERAAGNMPIQGGAQAILKLATNKIKGLRDAGQCPVWFKFLLQVHDELVILVKEEDAETLAQWIRPIMEEVVKLSVPVKANVKYGKTWDELY